MTDVSAESGARCPKKGGFSRSAVSLTYTATNTEARIMTTLSDININRLETEMYFVLGIADEPGGQPYGLKTMPAAPVSERPAVYVAFRAPSSRKIGRGTEKTASVA